MKIQINKILKYKYIGIVFLGIFCLLLPQFSYAVVVPVNYTSFWAYSKYFNRGGCSGGSWNGDFKAKTDFYMSLSKQFDLSSTNLGGLNQNESRVIRPGESITAVNYNVTGSYSYSSADSGTPPMDGKIYNWDYRSRGGDCGSVYDVKNQMRGEISSQLGYTLSSSNNAVIDCSAGTSCTAKSQTGTATITVSFPGQGSYYVQRAYDFGHTYSTSSAASCTKTYSWEYDEYVTTCTCPAETSPFTQGGFCRGTAKSGGMSCSSVQMCRTASTFHRTDGATAANAWNYSLSSINYNLTLEVPNQAPTVSYTSTTDISYNTAKANWSYSDPDGDAQSTYAVQVATDVGFANIVFSQSLSGGTTNMAVNSLIPGTTYYPRVAVQDAKGAWSTWQNGPSFTTLANNPPNLDQLSCNGVSTGYTSGKANWNYTGTDEPGDVLVLRLRYKKTTESIWTTVNLPGNRAGAQDIANLISGYGYNIEISLNDNRNVHLGDRWKGCGIFTTTEYPDPSVDFNLTSGSTTVAKGGTITIKTGDPISTNWTITNTVGLQDNSCALSTTGVRDIFRENNIGFESSRQNNNVAADKADQTYTINLSCTGKEARVPKSVNANITLKIESYPIISCIIKKKVVSTESPIAQVEGTISNANPQYTWEIKRYTGVGENYGSPITSTSAIQNFTLDYTGLGLGKYKPVIKANGAGSRTSEKECGEISNFGNRSIQEVVK